MKTPIIMVMMIGSLMLGEWFSRCWLGLGDPPLIQIDPDVEYLFVPSSSYKRFGNHVYFNSLSMRSPERPPVKAQDEIRILVIGDSVVNGGALIDQSELATEILSKDLGSKYWIGNVSAGSCWPANEHAYLNKFGWSDADVAIFIFSTHDLYDLPEFRECYGEDFPTKKPISALMEVITRYLPRYVPPALLAVHRTECPPRKTYTPEERSSMGPKAIKDLLANSKNRVRKTVVIIHPARDEIDHVRSSDREEILKLAQDENIPVYDVLDLNILRPSDYSDSIHLNAQGQSKYSDLLKCLLSTETNSNCPIPRLDL